MKNYLSLAAITLMAVFSIPATAEVEVVDSKPIPKNSVATRHGGYRTAGTVRQAPQNEAAQVYYQLQLLQQEVRELRGIVEEQAHKIKELNRKRTEDYIDLDRRLAGILRPGLADRWHIALHPRRESLQGGAPTLEIRDLPASALLAVEDLLDRRRGMLLCCLIDPLSIRTL